MKLNLWARSAAFSAVLLSSAFLVPNAKADDFDISYTGPEISGNLYVTATADGGGVYTVDSITGSQTLDGVAQAVTGVVPNNGSPYSCYPSASCVDYIYNYDNQLYTTTSPSLDAYGLLFTVAGESDPVNICSGSDNCSNPGEPYTELVYVGSGGNAGFNSAYEDYAITSFSITAPEPSSVLQLGVGLFLLAVAAVYRRRVANAACATTVAAR
jgi:hypothetical protein